MKLINLHTNTTFSFLESTIELDNLLNWAQKNSIEYLTITEHNNMLSYASFCIKARAKNIKTIYGIDIDAYHDDTDFRVILLAKNNSGLKEIFKLNFKQFQGDKIEFSQLENIPDIVLIDHPTKGYFKKYKKFLSNASNFYVGIDLRTYEDKNLNLDEANFLLVNENRIFDILENKTLDTLNWIKTQQTVKNFNTSIMSDIETDDPKLIQLIDKTNNLAKQLVINIEQSKFKMPVYPNPDNISSVEYLKKIVLENINWKLKHITHNREEYIQRVKYELNVITSLGFEDYFLIIWDFIKWAKKNNISTGPGRGSAAGSLISYLMDITQIDPIEYGLLFERFLNPKRVTMPDIDIDIQDDKRHLMIEYLTEKYGIENVATIVTFSTLGTKSAMRDAARSFEIPNPVIDSLAKKIPNNVENLEEAYEKSFSFKNELLKYSNHETGNNDLMEAFNEACQIQGFYRQSGTHAAGIVISQNKIIDKVPVMINSVNHLQTQLSMDYLETFGLLKIDILGLRTLTIINEILSEVWKIKPDFDIEKIPLNDKKTFDLLTMAKTAGIFQLESPGMRSTLLKVKVSDLNDIVAIISLFRPGTMEHISTYAKRKNKQESIPVVNEVFDEVTKDTYGIMVYQEQILKLVQRISKMDYAEADLLRRAISKKKIEEFEKFKVVFVQKAIANGYDEEFALGVFENIEKFAGYGFNKSHAVSYALITYRMAYLKAHYPLQFYSAIISSSINSLETLNKYCLEAQELGIEIFSPSLNDSMDISVIKNNKIYLPFGMVKGLGKVTESQIINEKQKNGPYKNLLEAILRLKSAGLGDEKIKMLVNASILREFDTQTNIIKNLENSTEFKFEILNAFDSKTKTIYWDKVNWNVQTHKFLQDFDQESINEINYLGRCYNISKTKKYESPNNRLIDIHEGTQHRIAVYVNETKNRISKTNKQFIIVTLSDSSATIDCFVWDSTSDIKDYAGKMIWVDILKTQRGDWKISNWKEINE
ncbi:DNA polymerase III subunit alpha [[Mycoplasma] gypis]|uniref:DNA-directed DNA polymerase n=1 Tax=[Mycoplasma] gypis TaxID=92404 RepID=A0ABZ2RNA3_9BACT|nr:DNA polymerase III subunit alpha [[Mycoplasma] gypis]MBN0919634.1 DNA polymerase III subunit alpha [[Mycoplasma] gypis]